MRFDYCGQVEVVDIAAMTQDAPEVLPSEIPIERGILRSDGKNRAGAYERCPACRQRHAPGVCMVSS